MRARDLRRSYQQALGLILPVFGHGDHILAGLLSKALLHLGHEAPEPVCPHLLKGGTPSGTGLCSSRANTQLGQHQHSANECLFCAKLALLELSELSLPLLGLGLALKKLAAVFHFPPGGRHL